MIFPNIQIITLNQNLYFSDTSHRSICRPTERYDYLKPIFNLDKFSAVVIVSQVVKFYKEVINFIKNNKFKNVYFFIDDVFRSSLENSFMPESKEFAELEIIDRIIKKVKIQNYKIFHCEEIDVKILNRKIHYADLFLNDFRYRIQKDIVDTSFKKDITYKVSCLNNRKDIHRHVISLLLCKKNDVFLTCNGLLKQKYIFNNKLFRVENLDKRIIDLLFSNYNYFYTNHQKFLDPNNKKDEILKFKDQHGHFVYDIIKDSFLNIVTETCYTSNFVNISEKTLKPMACYRPFVMLGAPGILKKLKDLGFKTFDRWWDESYDLELDHAKRLQKVYYIVEEILNKSDTELEKLLEEMTEVLIYNFNHLKTIEKYLVPRFN